MGNSTSLPNADSKTPGIDVEDWRIETVTLRQAGCKHCDFWTAQSAFDDEVIREAQAHEKVCNGKR